MACQRDSSQLPLRDRIIHSGSTTETELLASRVLCSRPYKYKAWTEEQMASALKAVVEKKLSVREAALRYDVPRSTLGDRRSGRIQDGSVSGPGKFLSTNEEHELVRFLCKCAHIGFPKTRVEVLSLVRNIIESKGLKSEVTSGWWESFCRRNPSMTLRAAAPLSKARFVATDPEVINRYFDLLEETLERSVLEDKPAQVFNMDETGMPLDPKSMKCVAPRGAKTVLAPSSGDKTQITVVACVSASGQRMPPLVILNRKRLPPYFSQGEVPETRYACTPKGWMDQITFYKWFKGLFLRFAPSVRPLLLLLDGHSSHYCPETIRLAASERVILFVLPPNMTHLLQPLDKGGFGPLKVFWREECQRYMSDNPGQYINRYCFSSLFSKAWDRCMTVSNIRAAFKTTGIFPVDRNAVQSTVSSQKSDELAQSSGLPFIPLFSPAPTRRANSRVGTGGDVPHFDMGGDDSFIADAQQGHNSSPGYFYTLFIMGLLHVT